MRLRFIGDGDTCEVFGVKFFKNRWTASHGLPDDLAERLAVNPTFEADGLPDAPEAEAVPTDPLEPSPAPAAAEPVPEPVSELA